VRLPGSTIPGECEWSFAGSAVRMLLAAQVDAEVMRRRKRFAAQWVEARLSGDRTEPRPDGARSAARTSERMELVGNLYLEGDDPRRAAVSLLDAADQARRQLRYDRARGLYLRGLRLLDPDDCARALEATHGLGDVSARLGRPREALAHFGEMLRVAWRMDLPAKGGAAHARIGRLHRSLGDYPRALVHLRMAHELFELAGDRRGVAASLDDMGRVHLLTGESERSMGHHRAALAVREELHDEHGKALTLS
jgi:tetratricopeptide (TPR) repeat protein